MRVWTSWIWLLLWVPTPSWAGQLCTQVSTGKLLEYQSEARVGTCLTNALTQGYAAADVQERTVTNEEWLAYREEKVDKPAREKQEKENPVEIPLSTFGGAVGGLAGAASLFIVARKKKEGT